MGSDYDEQSYVNYPKSHAGAYIRHPGFNLVAAADPSPDAIRRFGRKWDVSNLYKDAEEMLIKERPDVLSITSSTEFHIPILKLALNSSVRVIFMEKPVSYSLSEAKAIMPLVEASDKTIIVNYGRRWNRNNILIKSWIDSGKLGKFVKAIMYYSVGLIHTGTHGLDLIRWYFGDFSGVIGLGAVDDGLDHVLDACFELVDGGEFLTIGFHRANWNIWEMDILMERGRIRFLRGGRIIEIMNPEADPDFPKLKALEPKPLPQDNDWKNILTNAVESIYKIISKDSDVKCTFYDGVMALEAAQKAFESARCGHKWLKI